MNKRPKFFCESCGSEVKQNDKLCGHCGRFFSSVKCPSCGFSADSNAFKAGCPVCGYAFPDGSRPSNGASRAKGRPAGTDPLPWWMYALSVALLAALVALILIRK